MERGGGACKGHGTCLLDGVLRAVTVGVGAR